LVVMWLILKRLKLERLQFNLKEIINERYCK